MGGGAEWGGAWEWSGKAMRVNGARSKLAPQPRTCNWEKDAASVRASGR